MYAVSTKTTTYTSKEAFQNCLAHIFVYLNAQMGLIQDNKAWYMTKRFPKLKSKTEISISCFKYRGRDRVLCNWNKISSNICRWPELWQALNIPTSQCDLMMLRLNIPTARFMVNRVFPLWLWGWWSKSGKVSSAGTWRCRTAVPLYREAHTHSHKLP